MAIANGITSLIAAKEQSVEGTKATAASAKLYRRVSALFNTVTDSIRSNEKKQSQQSADTRLANFRVEGTLNGELSSTTYQDFIQSILRKDFVATPSIGPLTTIAAVADGFTDSANGFLAAGFKAGMVCRAAGFVATANNSINYVITAVTANKITTVAVNGTAITAEAAGASVTIAGVGKQSYVPTTAHTKNFFTFEIRDTDISVYRTFIDNLVSKMSVKIPPSGMSTIDFSFMGKTEDTPSGTEYFTTPTAQTTTQSMTSATGFFLVDYAEEVICTNFEYEIDGNVNTFPAVGTKYASQITQGKVLGSGTFTVFLEDDTYLEKFRNETEISLVYIAAETDLDASDFVSSVMPRVKITSSVENDSDDAKLVTCNFDILEYVGADTSLEATTISIQDSTL